MMKASGNQQMARRWLRATKDHGQKRREKALTDLLDRVEFLGWTLAMNRMNEGLRLLGSTFDHERLSELVDRMRQRRTETPQPRGVAK